MRLGPLILFRRGYLTIGSVALMVAGATLLGLSWNSGWNWERIATACIIASWFATSPAD